MKTKEYKSWLEQQKYQANTINSQMHRVGRVEEHYGDLDESFEKDQLAEIIKNLSYSIGVAGQGAIAQILSYMGDIVYEQEGNKVRGILVAESIHIGSDHQPPKKSQTCPREVYLSRLLPGMQPGR